MKPDSVFAANYVFSFSYSYYYGYGYFAWEKQKKAQNRKQKRPAKDFEGCQPNAGGLFYEPAFLVQEKGECVHHDYRNETQCPR